MAQEPFSSWFSDTTKFIHSCGLTLVIFIIAIYAIVTLIGDIF